MALVESAGKSNFAVARETAIRNETINDAAQENKPMELLYKYWPWGSDYPKPRGLRNLRLEGIFPNKEMLQAKRSVSPLGLGRPGGGAPVVTHSGRRLIRIREHPIIQFQWNKDLRKCVDNNLRYKTKNEEREQYKKQLDAQVAEKKLREQWEKQNDLDFYNRAGWSTENTLRSLTEKRENYEDNILKDYETFKRSLAEPPRGINKYQYPITTWKHNHDKFNHIYGNSRIDSALNRRRLSPLNKGDVNGEDLVSLLAKQRSYPLNMHLNTTDVTRGSPEERKSRKSDYLKELTNQMDFKKQRIKETKVNDKDVVRRHFEALDDFWGRPGHGAPRSTIKKGCLNRLLYDYTIYAR